MYDLSSSWSHDSSGRPSSRGRIVPLYESERLVSRMRGSPLGGAWHWPGPAPRLGPWKGGTSRGDQDLPRELPPPMARWLAGCSRHLDPLSPPRPPSHPGLVEGLSRINEWNCSPPISPTKAEAAAMQASSLPTLRRARSQYNLGWPRSVGWRPSYEGETPPEDADDEFLNPSMSGTDDHLLGGDTQRWQEMSEMQLRASTSLPALVATGQPRTTAGRF